MRIVISMVALVAALSAAGPTAAQTRPSIGGILGAVAREAGVPNSGPSGAAARLGGAVAQAAGGQLDHTAPAAASATRGSNFSPDLTVNLTSGGGVDASSLGGSCAGMVSGAPNFALTYTAGSQPLFMRVRSQGDTTLVVRNPDGAYGCSDDYNGLNPALRWDSPTSGTYHIWVGAIGASAPAVLTITKVEG